MPLRTFCVLAPMLLSVACSADVTPISHAAPADVIYETGGTHEVWERFDEATILGSDAMGPQLTAPVGPIARSGAPVTFTWTESEAALDVRPCNHSAIPRSRIASVMEDLLHPVAHAHNPVTGDMYRVIFDIPGADHPVRIITGATTYTPSADAWTRITSGTGPVTLTLEYAYLDTGHITDGPFRGPVTTLTIQ